MMLVGWHGVPATKKLMMQRASDSVNDLINALDAQWSRFATHHFNTRQQIDYIKQVKLDANERGGVVVEMDFSENCHLIVQHEVQQAHYNTVQATIFTINIQVNAQPHHSMAVISDCLEHDVKFVYAAQKIISQFVRDEYPRVRNLNYVTDGACQHFKSNKSILNLTHHHRDFGIYACWSFSATAHGKSSVDGIGASIKYRATRQTLSGDRTDAILTPRELYQFASKDSALTAFYVDLQTIQANARDYNLEARWSQRGAKGKLKLLVVKYLDYIDYFRMDTVHSKFSSIRSYSSQWGSMSSNINVVNFQFLQNYQLKQCSHPRSKHFSHQTYLKHVCVDGCEDSNHCQAPCSISTERREHHSNIYVFCRSRWYRYSSALPFHEGVTEN